MVGGDSGNDNPSIAERRAAVERHLLGSLLRGGNFAACAGLDEQAFRRYAHRLVFRACRCLQPARGAIMVDVADWLHKAGLLAELGPSAGASYSFLADLLEDEPTAALTQAHADDLRAFVARDRIALAAERLREAALAPDFDPETACKAAEAEIALAREGTSARGPAQEQPAGWRYAPVSCSELLAARRPEWMVSRVLVAGQPGVIGGPVKCLKSSIAIDLAVSLASGTPFLGELPVYRYRRTLVLSGESGAWAIAETARRICAERGVSLESLPLIWQFDLPKLSDLSHLHHLRAGIEADGIELVVADPLYLCLLGGVAQDVSASNMYQMGPLLANVSRACLGGGATPLLVHHTNRPAGKTNEPLQLTDLAYSGIAEYARQWLLVSRREPFEPHEPHRLWMSAGGSCGQGGLWGVDIDEGRLDEDFGGRKWEVTIRSAAATRDERTADGEKRKDQRKRDEDDKADRELLAALDAIDPHRQGASLRSARMAAGMGVEKVERTVARLIRQRIVEDVPGFKAGIAKGGSRDARAIRRVSNG